MALGDQVQIGTTKYEIEFEGAALLSMTLTGYTDKKMYDQEEHKDQRGATDMILLTNPRYEYTFSADVPASTDLSSVYEGAVVAFTNADGATTNGRVTSVTKTRARSVMTVSVTILREDSMQSSYDADETPATPTVSSITDEGSGVGSFSVAYAWTTAANRPSSIEIYTGTTSTRPSSPSLVYSIDSTDSSGSLNTPRFEVNFGEGETAYVWAKAVNGTLSSAYDSESLALS